MNMQTQLFRLVLVLKWWCLFLGRAAAVLFERLLLFFSWQWFQSSSSSDMMLKIGLISVSYVTLVWVSKREVLRIQRRLKETKWPENFSMKKEGKLPLPPQFVKETVHHLTHKMLTAVEINLNWRLFIFDFTRCIHNDCRAFEEAGMQMTGRQPFKNELVMSQCVNFSGSKISWKHRFCEMCVSLLMTVWSLASQVVLETHPHLWCNRLSLRVR